jgi:hypothetical protein
MLKAHVWDEISGEWGTHELDLPPDTRDPELINTAYGKLVMGDDKIDDEEGDGWRVQNHSFTGPILTIEARSYTNKLSIIIVNYEG